MITKEDLLKRRESAIKLTPKGREMLYNSIQVRTDERTITLIRKK